MTQSIDVTSTHRPAPAFRSVHGSRQVSAFPEAAARFPALPILLALPLFLLALNAAPALAQGAGAARVDRPAGLSSISQHNGVYLPSAGDIRGLVVFIQTRNDTQDDTTWPLGSLPSWSATFAAEMRNYFLAMSGGRLRLTLDVYPSLAVTAMTERTLVESGKNFGNATREILERIDPDVRFADYDNWSSEGRPYNVIAGGEGQVDLIIAVYRRVELFSFLIYSGVSDLGFNGHLFVDGASKYVYGSSGQANDAAASGLTLCKGSGQGLVTDYDYALRVSIHEFMHKLGGDAHPTNVYGGLGVLSRAGGGLALSSLERHMLGYINYIEMVPGFDTTITLFDYLTTDMALLIPIPQAERWYYAVEFRNKTSPYDSAPAKGVYIYRIDDSWSLSQRGIAVLSADGNHRWALDSATGKLFKLYADPIGGSNAYQGVTIGGKTYYPDGWAGDTASAFTLRRPYFGTGRNPSSDFLIGPDTIHTGLSITIVGMTDTEASVRISYRPNSILDASEAETRAFTLAQNYPNPATAGAPSTIAFTLPAAGRATLRVYDALGREVATPLDRTLSAGTHHTILPAGALPAGVYTYILQSGKERHHRTMIILSH